MSKNQALKRLKLPGSLGARLLLFIGMAILLVAVLQGAFAYRNALEQTDTLFDYQMQQTAFALRAGLPVDAKGRPQGTPPEDENNEFIVQVWTNEGLRIFESALGDALPQMAVLGFADVPARGTTYRVFSLQTRSQVIQIAQDMRVRQMLARDAAWRSLLPVVLLLPLLALAVWWVIRRSLTPVHRVRRELALRQPQDLAPVAEHDLPDEMRPLVEELNSLLQRVRQAFEAQQNFVADAAHELRSPLAALQLQLQLLRKATDSAEREAAQARLAQGIERARRLVEQLLALARQEARPQSEDAPLADLRVLVEQALADAAPAAQAKGLDMGLSEDPQQQSAFSVLQTPGHWRCCCAICWTTRSNTCLAEDGSMWAGCRTNTDVHWWWKTRVLALHRPSVSASCSALCEVKALVAWPAAVAWDWRLRKALRKAAVLSFCLTSRRNWAVCVSGFCGLGPSLTIDCLKI